MIIAPVSRLLAVANPERSIAFYREVLGFEVQPVRGSYGFPASAELVSGKARLQVGRAEAAPDGTGQERARGAAILFFETDDLTTLHAELLARGGKPSSIEKVNWIKYRVFELEDPDGHILWFGQSYHVADDGSAADLVASRHIPAGSGQLRQALPELPLNDVSAGVAHYRDVLGFRINYAQDDLGVMDRDEITVVLIKRTDRHTGIGSCYVYVEDADALHAELVAKGANVLDQPVSMPWGLRQFRVLDLEGNRITFGQPFE